MISGMLWFDNDPKTALTSKIDRAAQYYKTKYGQTAEVCYLNPRTKGEAEVDLSGLEVKTSEIVLPFHFWIGLKQGEAKGV
ncbi:MAG: hypothetical protein P8046_05385 [Anaerolineales bacterium]